jgi:septal ring factor EnvC (AmiA/AmiB activator)
MADRRTSEKMVARLVREIARLKADLQTSEKMNARLAYELARLQCKDPRVSREVRDVLIRKYVAAHHAGTGDKLDLVVVPHAAAYFKVSVKTVWNALAATKGKKLQSNYSWDS